MRTRLLFHLSGATILGAALAGCGVARSLTTQHRTYAYSLSLPPVPANTMAHGQYTLDEQVENTYHKYHGGIDWTKLAYHFKNSSALQPVTLKLYVSLMDAVPANQLDQQATLIDTITLTPGEDRTVTVDQAAKNDVLRAFLATALSQNDVTTVHFYAASTSTDATAMVTVQQFTTQVQVHGSYF